MKSLFDEPLPFSDYMILQLVNLLGVEWLDFYYLIYFLLVCFAIGGWVVAFYTKTKCYQNIQRALDEEQNK